MDVDTPYHEESFVASLSGSNLNLFYFLYHNKPLLGLPEDNPAKEV